MDQLMTARWVLLEQLFHEAVDLPPESRAAFLVEACAEDKELYREIESLLACSDATLSELTEPVQLTAGEMIRGDRQGQRIGPYRLIRLLGYGGMGVVFLAERADGQYSRRVAIKLMSAVLSGSPAMLIRFRAERQILARLEHPNIARLLDGGMTDDGQPYLVIEYVDGEPLNEYCRRVQPSLSARLHLFLEICDAVEYAHRYLVIHRDLKPANIFVTADGQPKLLDFGLARLLDPSILGLSGAHTSASERLLTPEYASPEQIRGEAISTATDVFGLGILLYELLVGRRPFEVENPDPMALARAVCEQEPPPPSSIAKLVSGDLDHIVLMALRKEPDRRYATTAQLSADIRAFLNGLPVAARTGSFRYRLAKFVRRHKTAVAAAVIFLFTLAGFSGAMAILARRADSARAAAQSEALIARQSEQTAQAINDFLQNDLLAQASSDTQSGPGVEPDPHLEVRTTLDRAAARLRGKFDRQPEIEAAIRDTIAQTYRDLGLYAAARTQLERAVELYRRVLGVENPKTLRTMSRLARAVYNLGDYPQAEVLFKQTLAIQRRVLGSEHPDTLSCMTGLAATLTFLGRYAQAEALVKQTLEIQRRVLGPESLSTLVSIHYLSIICRLQGRYAEAEALYRHVLDVDRHILGPDHPKTLSAIQELAIIYNLQGKYTQSEGLNSEVLAMRRRVLGPEHRDTLYSMINLAESILFEGKYPQAEALSSQALELERRVRGPQNRYTLEAMDDLANAASLRSKFTQAEALFGSVLEISRRVLGPEDRDTLRFLSDVAFMYQRRGKYALAEVFAKQALAGGRHALGSELPATMASAADLALAYQSQHKFSQSETLAHEALEFYRKKQLDDWQRFRAESVLGASLSGQKRYAEAEPLLLEGYQGMLDRKERMAVPDWYHLDLARQWTVELYRAWHKPMKAAEWRQKG